MTVIVTEQEVRTTQRWITELGRDYRGEVPTRIHASSHGEHYGLGAAPPFAPEFIAYIGRLNCEIPNCSQCRDELPAYLTDARVRNPESRTRVTRVMRKLRRAAPLEYDVLNLAIVYGLNVEQIAEKLTARAIDGGHPERYDVASVTILAVAGVDKIGAWM